MKKDPRKRTRRKASRMEAMLAGGHAAAAVARCVRRCQDEGHAALRAPLPEARWEAFALALFGSRTVTDAAVAAGYSAATAKQQGSRLLSQHVHLRRRVAGLYEEALRSVRRQVLEKGDALARATDRHEARRRMMLPAWRLIGKTAAEVGRTLEALAAEGWDVSLVEPVMKLVREERVVLGPDGTPLPNGRGGIVTAAEWVSRCEGVKFCDERDEEAHLGRLLGWYPEPDGSGNREIERLRGEVAPGFDAADGGADGGAAGGAAGRGPVGESVPVIAVPADDEPAPFPRGEEAAGGNASGAASLVSGHGRAKGAKKPAVAEARAGGRGA